MTKKVAFQTLGCKLNFSETSTIAREFEEGGFARATRGEIPDIVVINTCSVTEHADKKCRNIIRKAIKDNPEAIIAVTGCYAQLKPSEIAKIEGVDIVVGNNDKGMLYSRVREYEGKGNTRIHHCESQSIDTFFAAFSSGDRTRAFMKIQDGCDYHCTYCTIPKARGASRNISIESLMGQAQEVSRKGQKEIVLTGVNIGDFGRTTGESFLDLISELDKVEGIERYRISSIEPNLITDQVIEFCAGSRKFQPHFHIPLQSGCDKILALMRRRYNTSMFAERIANVRDMIPDAFIGIDVIVGFPGETDEDFEVTYKFLEILAPAFLHVFPYSERPGTPAVEMSGKVPAPESAQRVKRLGELSDRLYREFCLRYAGTDAEILVESTIHGGKMEGFTGNYIRVEIPADRSLSGKMVKVKLSHLLDNGHMSGEIIAD